MTMKNDVCGIYMIENKKTGQRYIGQSIHIYQRWHQHINRPQMSMHIDRAIKKHGADNFDLKVICELEQDDDLLNAMEKYYVWKYNTFEDNFHYNLTLGGDFSPSKLSEVREKISKTKNTTGYFRVHKNKNPECRQGFRYCYRYYDDNGKRHSIQSVDIKKLEKKVKAKGLEWFKLEE